MVTMMEKFLTLVPNARWRLPPPVWRETYRKALSDDLVTPGWGGILKLTAKGRETIDGQLLGGEKR